MTRWPPRSTLTATLVPYTTLFRSLRQAVERLAGLAAGGRALAADELRHQLELLAEAMLQLVVLHGGAARLLADRRHAVLVRSEEHPSELQSLMRISYAVFCLKKKRRKQLERQSIKHRLDITI